MKIVKPSVEVFFHYPEIIMHEMDGACIPTFLERVGRTCYKSEDKITQGSASKFIRMLKDRGHHAMLEHCVASVKFISDRGFWRN
jgi:thymidylate synthase (FAD)